MWVLALTAVAVAPASTALAQQEPRPVDFSLTPVDHDGYFKFTAQPGGTVGGAVALANHTAQPLRLRLAVTDLGTANTGGAIYPDGKPTKVGTWITLAQTTVSLPANSTQQIDFTVQVPIDARGGQHYGGIVAFDPSELRTDAAQGTDDDNTIRLRQLTRLALPVLLTLPGDKAPGLEVAGAEFGADAAGSRLDLELANTGNWLIRGSRISLDVMRDGRKLFAHEGELADFIPNTTIAYPIPWRGRAAEGEYRLIGTIEPQGAAPVEIDETVRFGHEQTDVLEDATGEAAVPESDTPILLYAALVLAAIVVALAAASWWRMRRRLKAAEHA